MSPTVQVGYTYNGNPHAALGRHGRLLGRSQPGWSEQFDRAAVFGTQQAGVVHVGITDHASVWTGSAATWVDINPTVADSSVAYAISSGQIVGYANVALPSPPTPPCGPARHRPSRT